MSAPTRPEMPGSATRAVDAGSAWTEFAPDLTSDRVLWSEVVPGGGHAHWILARGTTLRLAPLGARPNCSVVLYCWPRLIERYNMPDSLKAQHTARYSQGHVLMTDMGRAIASVTTDTLGWHDPFGALLDTATMEQRYGEHRFDPHRNGMHRSGRDGLLLEIGKHGLTARELIEPVNLFSKVTVDEHGRFHFEAAEVPAGSHVDLRCDMDVLLALSTSPHPLDARPTYEPAPIGLAAWRSGIASPDDQCRNSCPENARAHYNSDMYFAR